MKPEESEEDFYKRILRGLDKDLDEIVLGLLDRKANLQEWLEKSHYDIDKFKKVLLEAGEKLFAVDYFSCRIMDFQGPDDPMPHNEMRERLKTLIYMLGQSEPLVNQRKKAKRTGSRKRGPSKQKQTFEKYTQELNVDCRNLTQKDFLDAHEDTLNEKGVSTNSIKKYFSEKKKPKKKEK